MMTECSSYDSWHSKHVDDNDISTPWHDFVKSSLRSVDLEDKSVLEIGCGRGGFSELLVKQYPLIKKLCACDYSESALMIAKNRLGTNGRIDLRKEDIQNLSFPDESFDTVISCETIEHVPHPRLALKELHRVLKPGGRLILTCPNYFNLFGIWCIYRIIIGKPYTEGGQPFVNYILLPAIYLKLRGLGFTVNHLHATELILPARVPKTYYKSKVPAWLTIFGSRTYYVLIK